MKRERMTQSTFVTFNAPPERMMHQVGPLWHVWGELTQRVGFLGCVVLLLSVPSNTCDSVMYHLRVWVP